MGLDAKQYSVFWYQVTLLIGYRVKVHCLDNTSCLLMVGVSMCDDDSQPNWIQNHHGNTSLGASTRVVLGKSIGGVCVSHPQCELHQSMAWGYRTE